MNADDALLAGLLSGRKRLRDVKGVCWSHFASISQQWIFILVTGWLERGHVSPDDDEILLRRIRGYDGPNTEEQHAWLREHLEGRPFLRDVSEAELRAELARLRGLQ